jgi:2-polyprenyl-3-methyl-5-hydroxy-6-metoxy-1,4-benzoquinol methylase
MIIKKYNSLYSKDIFKINVPQNTITRIFLSRMSPLKKKFKGKKILDFSCGSGPYLNFFLNLGFKVFATEISYNLISILKKKI